MRLPNYDLISSEIDGSAGLRLGRQARPARPRQVACALDRPRHSIGPRRRARLAGTAKHDPPGPAG